MKRVFTMVIFCIICVLAHQANATSIKPFTISSRQEIEKMHQGRAFILAFWSMDCLYCLDELSILVRFINKHPKVKLVLVSTDGQSTSAELLQALKKIDLPPNAELWQFSDSDEERLRYSIDKSWYGELPRTYYYDKSHQVKPLSGSPKEEWLGAWVKNF